MMAKKKSPATKGERPVIAIVGSEDGESLVNKARLARARAAAHEIESKIRIKKAVDEGPKRRQRTVTTTRQSPYGTGVDEVQLGLDTDVLEHLHYRRFIDVPQKQAGDRFKAAFEAASGSHGLGFDYTQERVDTSRSSQAISEAVINGMHDMATAASVLGKIDFAIVYGIAGVGQTIGQYAARVGDGGERAREYVGARFKDALTALAVEWGYQRADKARSRAHRWAGDPSDEAFPEQAAAAPWVHPANRPKDK